MGNTKFLNIGKFMNLSILCLLFISLFFVFSFNSAFASVSGFKTYSTSFVNPLPIAIPVGVSISVSISSQITGSATIKSPGGNIVATIGMAGGVVTLNEIGTYQVSENYHLEITGKPDIGDPQTLTDDASSQWTFSNTVQGSKGTFQVSPYINLSPGPHSDNLSVKITPTGATATTTKPIPPGGSASASVNISWGVNTSMNIETPPQNTGTIIVNTNLDAATFNISGPASYSGSGKSWSVANAPVGSYTISYNPVAGYQTPPSETKTLVKDGSITFSGTYIQLPTTGSIIVNTNLDQAAFDISGPANYSGSGKSWSTANAPKGDYTISYKPVEGYQTPPSETKTLSGGGTITFTGTYILIPNTGTIIVNTNLNAAQFDIFGPANYSAGGIYWSTTNAPVGNYTITYKPVTGYQTPPSETKTLNKGGTITFTGTYTVMPGVGNIVVNTNLDMAGFDISGPANYSGRGKSWSTTNAPVGTYTISYMPVAGYQTPPSESKVLIKDGTITFTGTYTEIPKVGTILVNTNLDSAGFDISGPANYSGSGKSWSNTNAPVGSYTITYKPVVNYQTPPSETKELTVGGTISFSGVYTEIPNIGTIVVNTNLDAASFDISGPANYSGSGKSWSTANAPSGNYTINYKPIMDYESPPSETKTLARGGSITFVGTYTEKPKMGAIIVITNLDEASFSLSGPVSYNGNGKSWTVNSTPIGGYTIVYKDVPGYKTPQSETKYLAQNGIMTFTGNYIEITQTGTIVVKTNLDSALFNISGPKTFSGSGKSKTWPDVPLGTYTITYGSLSGYRTPEPETKTLAQPDEIITFTGEYKALGGTIVVNTNLDSASFDITGPENRSGSGKSQTWNDMPLGSYTATYKPVPGYRSPQSDTRTLRFYDDRIVFNGVYTPLPPVITSIEISGSPAKLGDIISLLMKGDPKNTAKFSIVGVVNDLAMTEDPGSPGLYKGEYNVPEGISTVNATVSIKLTNSLGLTTTDQSKKVTIDSIPPILSSVDVMGSPAKKPGDIITVKCVGETTGNANFSIEGVTQGIPMLEDSTSPGLYIGYYKAAEGLNVRNRKVSVALKDGVGNITTNESKSVSIRTAPWDVNSDGIVGFFDINAVGQKLGKISTDNDMEDVNEDGIIDILDLVFVGKHFGERYK